MPPASRPSPRARVAVRMTAVVLALGVAVVACRSSDEPPQAVAIEDAGTSPGTSPGSVPGTEVATIPPTEAPSSTVVTTRVTTTKPTSTVAPTAPPTAAAPTSPRGLPTASTTMTFVDQRRPTVSRGTTIAPTRTLRTQVTYPSSGGPYPLVVFAHGYQLGPSSYQRIINVIAGAGYVVAAPSFPLADASVAGANLDRGDIPNQSGDLRFVIDQLIGGSLAARIDASRVGAVGHSDGADTVLDLGYDPNRLDARVRAVAALSPDAMSSAGGGGAPLLIMHGDHDSIVPYREATTVFGQVSVHRFLVTLIGADHLPPVQGAAPWATVVDRAVLDLLDHDVAGRTGSDDALVNDATVGGVASVRRAG